MAEGEWSKSYVIPSVILSLTAAGFLIWHLFDPATHVVSGWTITLIVVGFLPWLRTVFESIEFPGGGSLTWRKKVEAEQERQAGDIRALRFLTARFLKEDERIMLQRLASGVTIPVRSDSSRDTFAMQALTSLHRSGLIKMKPGTVDALDNQDFRQPSSFNELWDVTVSGREYLDILAELPEEADPRGV